QFSAFAVENLRSTAPPVLPKRNRIEVGGTHLDYAEAVLDNSRQRSSAEIIQVLRVKVAVSAAEHACGQRFEIQHKHEAQALRLEQRPGFLQKLLRFSQVLQDGPEGKSVELPPAKILPQEIAAHHRDAS